jgi:hypothetical protein
MRKFANGSVALLLAAISGLSDCGGDKPLPVRTYPMGDHVQVGHVIYTVFETQWMTQLGEGTGARVPQDRFFLVRVSAVNAGSGDVLVPSFALEGDDGKVYNESSDGGGVPQWIGYLRQVKPAEAAAGNAVFDAPPRHYKLRVTDETLERAALIDIPLSFGAETPEIPTPGSEKKQP